MLGVAAPEIDGLLGAAAQSNVAIETCLPDKIAGITIGHHRTRSRQTASALNSEEHFRLLLDSSFWYNCSPIGIERYGGIPKYEPSRACAVFASYRTIFWGVA